MEVPPLPTAQAAQRLGITVSRFHKLADAHQVAPAVRGAGRRGAKFWNPADVDLLAALIADRLAS